MTRETVQFVLISAICLTAIMVIGFSFGSYFVTGGQGFIDEAWMLRILFLMVIFLFALAIVHFWRWPKLPWWKT